MLAQVGGSEALWELPEQDESLEERLNAWVGKTQARGALTASCDRSVDGLQGKLVMNRRPEPHATRLVGLRRSLASIYRRGIRQAARDGPGSRQRSARHGDAAVE